MEIDRRSMLGGLAAVLGASGSSPGHAAPESDGFTVLEAGPATLALRDGARTAALGYDERAAGPILRLSHGEKLKVRLVNRLDQPTTICWHGVRGQNAMDGVGGLTQPPVASGASFEYRFTPPDAGTFWLHPHVFRQSTSQLSRGLYGALIVEEKSPPKVDDDRLVMIDDWALDAKGQIVADAPAEARTLITVNARPAPDRLTARPGARLRFRLLNACAERIAICLVEGAEATVIAIDGQPSEIFQPARAMVPIGPGSRFDLLVDLPREAGKTAKVVLAGDKGATQSLIEIATKGEPVTPYPPVAKLPENPALPTIIHLERSLRRELAIERLPPATGGAPTPWHWSLAGVPSDGFSSEPLFVVKRGGVVTLTFVNRTDATQQMHMHGHVWRLLHDLDDGWDPYWRDSVLIAAGRTKHVAFVADNPGKWAIESSMLERQDSGLIGWFEVK